MRDNFTEHTKRVLALRVGVNCSNPSCRTQTSGPQVDASKTLNIGVAAHITAAAEGGTRYDPTLTAEQRRSPQNGIWLCQNCAKLVDNDEVAFPVDKLRRWKRRAESEARLSVGRSIQIPPADQLSAEALDILRAAADTGDIWILGPYQDGTTCVRVAITKDQNHDFHDENDPAIGAAYVDGLEQLKSQRLVKHQSGLWYQLTGTGFQIARELKSRLETST